ncbi:hypothetical protein JJJ02_04240 [Macrococcus sp. PK]|nr:hypothetical protein [Macrococcus sp. PK]MCH4984567.1 hypothetical protein [Macrococcus sp. PK]
MKVKGLYATFITVILLGIFFLLSLPYVKEEKDLINSEKASVAAMFLTTEAVVAEMPEDTPAMSDMGMGGMPGLM